MANKIIFSIYILIAILFFIKYIIYKKDMAFAKKIQDIFTKDGDPEKALVELDNKIRKSSSCRINFYLLDKYFALIWLGQWQDAKLTASKINLKKIGVERKYRYEYFSLLLKFLSEEFEDIDSVYHRFITSGTYNHIGEKTLSNNIFYILYMLYIKKDYINVIEELDKIINNANIHIIYLGLFYYCYAISKLNLGETLEAEKYFAKAMVFGEKTFIKEKAENYLKQIKKGYQDSIITNDEIDRIISEAYEERTKRIQEITIKMEKGK